MKKLFMILSLTLVLCFIFCCQPGEELVENPVADVEADIEAIRNWVNLSYAAAGSGDFERYISFWAEDLIWMPPNGPIIQGKSAATEMLQPYFEQVAIQHKISIKEIKVTDDIAFTRFNAQETYTTKSGEGESGESNFKAIIFLQRMSDGEWLGTHLIWNSNDPLPTPEENQ